MADHQQYSYRAKTLGQPTRCRHTFQPGKISPKILNNQVQELKSSRAGTQMQIGRVQIRTAITLCNRHFTTTCPEFAQICIIGRRKKKSYFALEVVTGHFPAAYKSLTFLLHVRITRTHVLAPPTFPKSNRSLKLHHSLQSPFPSRLPCKPNPAHLPRTHNHTGINPLAL